MPTLFPTRSLTVLAGAILVTTLVTSAWAQSGEVDPIIDWPMVLHFRDGPLQWVCDPKLPGLWERALAQSDANTRLLALDALWEAQGAGVKGLESFIPRLEAILNEAKQDPAVWVGAARLLVALDDKNAAPGMLALCKSIGPDMILVTDPGLGKWHYAPAIEGWHRRIEDTSGPQSLRVSALNAVGLAGDATAAGLLKNMTLDRALAPSLRLGAACALALVSPDDGEETARLLLAGIKAADIGPGPALPRLLAASVLAGTHSAGGGQLLLRLAQDAEPAVATVALTRLLVLGIPGVETGVVALAPALLNNADANVRRLAAQVLLKKPTAEGIALLFPLLGDPVPEVRTWVRDQMIKLGATPELSAVVRGHTQAILGGAPWRSLEQAALVAGKLNMPEAAGALVKLADHPRGEVALAAIVAIRWLNLPAMAGDMLAAAETARQRGAVAAKDMGLEEAMRVAGKPASFSGKPVDFVPANRRLQLHDDQLCQAIVAMAQWTYRPAEPLVRSFLPKDAGKLGMFSARLASFWAIGRLHANDPNPELVGLLVSRAQDIGPMPPGEPDPIRLQAVAALGVMGARDALLKMKKNFPMNAEWVDWVLNPDAPLPPAGFGKQTFGFLRSLPEDR